MKPAGAHTQKSAAAARPCNHQRDDSTKNAGWQVRGVVFSFGAARALDGIDCEFAPGRFHGIIGPNGSGKTTLLDLLAGLARPQAGRVLFAGREMASFGRRWLARRIALVPQEFGIGFGFTVGECVMMGRHPHLGTFARPGPEDEEKALAAIRAMDLETLAARPVTALSGGEKQRVAVARALAQDTPALLLDEPTSSLDIRHTIAIMRHCRRLADNGRTVVAVVHDLNLACGFCDRVTVLDRGRVAAAGPPETTVTPQLLAAVFGVGARIDTSGPHPRILFDYHEDAHA